MAETPTYPRDRGQLIESLRAAGAAKLPGHLGFELDEIGDGTARMHCVLEEHHIAPNGYLHAGSIIALADTVAGYGCIGNMPEGGTGFTTIETKTNFVATLLEGTMLAEATLVHGGRTTQVWDVEVSAKDTGKTLAYFRCTQMILYPAPLTQPHPAHSSGT